MGILAHLILGFLPSGCGPVSSTPFFLMLGLTYSYKKKRTVYAFPGPGIKLAGNSQQSFMRHCRVWARFDRSYMPGLLFEAWLLTIGDVSKLPCSACCKKGYLFFGECLLLKGAWRWSPQAGIYPPHPQIQTLDHHKPGV